MVFLNCLALMVGLGPSCTLATAALIEFKASSGADAPRVFDSFIFLASGPGGVMLLLAPSECQSQAVGQQTRVSFPGAAHAIDLPPPT